MSAAIIIVGGGIVGLATAFKAAQRLPSASVTVLEKERSPGMHQTTHNSGVLHCGLYYRPGSAKAQLAVSGIRQMIAFCREHNVPHEICGKLVVAAEAAELPRLGQLFERGEQNGLQGLRLLKPDEMSEIEPHAAGVGALHVPQEGIVDYAAVCRALSAEIEARGGKVITGAKVLSARQTGQQWRLRTPIGEFAGDFLVNCAGLYSDTIAKLCGHRPGLRIVPFRGEYYKLAKERQHLVRHLIYPVPAPAFPFLGVHFTRLIHGGIEAGPNAVLAFCREGYRKTDVKLGELADAVGFPGLWRFLAKHPSMCWGEMRRSFSRRLFCESLQRLVPDLREEDLEPGGAGVRAQAMLPDGTLAQDFAFAGQNRALHVLNAPSPAATASLAIADEIVDRIGSPI